MELKSIHLNIHEMMGELNITKKIFNEKLNSLN